MTVFLSMRNIIKYRVRGLKDGQYPVHLKADTAALEIAPFIGDVSIDGELIIGEQLDFHLTLTAKGIFICDRCGIEFEREFSTKAIISFTEEDVEDDTDELYLHHYDPQLSPDVDLTEDIHDVMLLAIPMKNLHSEDCTGIPQENIEIEDDERTILLKSLLEKLQSEESKGPM
jgi:uncharacterized metal-binding protein YceD (DUF177 family)